MNKNQWKYKITSGLASVILSFIMLIGFGYLAIWMHTSKNDAIIVGRIVVIFAALAFILALHRAIFFKFFIGKDGFFHQSRLGNGKYYDYHEIRNAWISSGRETNAHEMNYCHYETNDGRTVRFPFTGADVDAVQYFLKCVEMVETVDDRAVEDNREYKISGKVQGKQQIAVTIFIWIIILVLAFSLAQYGISPIAYVVPVVLGMLSVGFTVIRYKFYKIEIERTGFFCQTNPFNGKY